MARTITAEERTILLENPELVMFNPYRAFKSHRGSLGKALIAPVITGAMVFLWAVLFPHYINTHPWIFVGIGCAAVIAASGAVPVVYLRLDDRKFRQAEAEHYAEQLRILLPETLTCRIAHVQWITYEKAEGGWILDGKEEMFGYASYVNCFRIEPDTDLAVISDGSFFALVKRDVRTERFYQE